MYSILLPLLRMKFGYFNSAPSRSRYILDKRNLKYINVKYILQYHTPISSK